MSSTESIVRTGPYMTHVALVVDGKIMRLKCSNRVPKSAAVTDATHVVCNKCEGANRMGTWR